MPASVGWRGFGGDGISTTTTDVTKLGTLVVDIFDGQKQKLIWRGKQSDALSGNPEKMKRSTQRTSLICSNTSLHHTEGMLDQLHGIEGPLTSRAFIHVY